MTVKPLPDFPPLGPVTIREDGDSGDRFLVYVSMVGVRAELVRRTEATLLGLDLAGIDPPVIREGTVGADARALGAAAIPLSQRYLIDQNAAVREG